MDTCTYYLVTESSKLVLTLFPNLLLSFTSIFSLHINDFSAISRVQISDLQNETTAYKYLTGSK